MKNVPHNKVWHTVAVQIHVDILPISLNKSKNNASNPSDGDLPTSEGPGILNAIFLGVNCDVKKCCGLLSWSFGVMGFLSFPIEKTICSSSMVVMVCVCV